MSGCRPTLTVTFQFKHPPTKLDFESYYDSIVKYCHDYTHGGAGTLPYRRLISKAPKKTSMSAGAIYAIISQMLGHVLKALNKHWPGEFNYYKLIWKAIKNSQPT